ncbi:MAG: methylamine utilization protein [Zoogloeaceae bacterium]|nr:methylamine utilization protein [Zoogloeaceae bacterium]
MRRLLPSLLAVLALPCAGAELAVAVSGAGGVALPGAVVFLQSDAAAGAARPLPQREIGQESKTFVPGQLVITRGTAVNFPNRDTVRHHVYSFSPAKRFELKLYIGTPAEPVVFDTAGVAVLGCNIHDEMVAWVVIVDTPYYAETGVDGRTVLRDVPPGAYTLRAWHRGMLPGSPATEQAVRVSANGGVAAVSIAGVRP